LYFHKFRKCHCYWALSIFNAFPDKFSDEIINKAIESITAPVDDNPISVLREEKDFRRLDYEIGLLDIPKTRVKKTKCSSILHTYALPTKSSPKCPEVLQYSLPSNVTTKSLKMRMGKIDSNQGIESFEDEILMYAANRRFYPKSDIIGEFEKGVNFNKIKIYSDFPCHYSGDVAFIPTKNKIRHIAMPFRYEQLLLKPLGDILYSRLKNLEWDFTFRQEEGVLKVQQALIDGKTCHCYDLKSATDHIPLKSQITLLNHLFVNLSDEVELFSIISRGMWRIREKSRSQTKYRPVRWSKGQPLGLYPSFAAFALWHGYTCQNLLCRKYKDDFFILGDDIVITDPALAGKYELMLQDLNIPLSHNKCVISKSMAEFAGHVIFPDSIIPSLHWTFDVANILQIGRAFGPKVRKFFRDEESMRLLDIVGDLPSPLGCNWFSNRDYSLKTFICESILSHDLPVQYGDPGNVFEKNASSIPSEWLNSEEIEALRDSRNRTLKSSLGTPDITRYPEFLIPAFGLPESIGKMLFRSKDFNYNETTWIESLIRMYNTIITIGLED
jgi:hypothetical protein